MKDGLTTSEKGAYILIIRVPKLSRMRIGCLGKINFKRGFYAYVGSALNGLKPRIERHLSDKKRVRWHVDYLIESSKIVEVIYGISPKRKECEIENYLARELDSIEKFGSSDCNCKGHLFYSKSLPKLRKSIFKAFGESNLNPVNIKINNNGHGSFDRHAV